MQARDQTGQRPNRRHTLASIHVWSLVFIRVMSKRARLDEILSEIPEWEWSDDDRVHSYGIRSQTESFTVLKIALRSWRTNYVNLEKETQAERGAGQDGSSIHANPLPTLPPLPLTIRRPRRIDAFPTILVSLVPSGGGPRYRADSCRVPSYGGLNCSRDPIRWLLHPNVHFSVRGTAKN